MAGEWAKETKRGGRGGKRGRGFKVKWKRVGGEKMGGKGEKRRRAGGEGGGARGRKSQIRQTAAAEVECLYTATLPKQLSLRWSGGWRQVPDMHHSSGRARRGEGGLGRESEDGEKAGQIEGRAEWRGVEEEGEGGGVGGKKGGGGSGRGKNGRRLAEEGGDAKPNR